jgi:putative transposase
MKRAGSRKSSLSRWLKALEEENAKLKKLLAEHARCGGPSRAAVKKMVGPAAKHAAVAHLQDTMGLSERPVRSTRSGIRAARKIRLPRCRAAIALRASLRTLPGCFENSASRKPS